MRGSLLIEIPTTENVPLPINFSYTARTPFLKVKKTWILIDDDRRDASLRRNRG